MKPTGDPPHTQTHQGRRAVKCMRTGLGGVTAMRRQTLAANLCNAYVDYVTTSDI